MATTNPEKKEEEAAIQNPTALDKTDVDANVSDSDANVSDDDAKTLRRVADSLPPSVFLVCVAEMAERFTYRCLTGPLQNYIQNARDDPLRPGALGRGQPTATALGYFFTCWCYLTPLFGGIIADTWLGRYPTIELGTAISTVGILILFATSLPQSLNEGAGFPGLIVALLVIGLGFGGIKANVNPLIAEQYAGRKPYVRTLKSGERVLVDPSITVQNIYNIYYWMINLGALSGFPATWIELKADFWCTYLMAFAFCCLALATTLLGHKRYLKRVPRGSVIVNAGRALYLGARHGNMEAAKPSYQRARGQQNIVPWDDKFVEELQRAFYACKVFLVYPIYWICYGQTNNNLTSLAGSMRTDGAPNDMFLSFGPVFVILFIPLIRSGLYPFLRKHGIPFNPIARITFGFLCVTACMAIATGIQYLVYSRGPCYDHPLECPESDGGRIPNDVDAFTLVPAFFFAAMSEIFAYVTGLEYAFTKAPSSMKSICSSLYLLTCALGSALGVALSPTSQNPLISTQFSVLTGIMLVVSIGFYLTFNRFDAREEELNKLETAVGDEAARKQRDEETGSDTNEE